MKLLLFDVDGTLTIPRKKKPQIKPKNILPASPIKIFAGGALKNKNVITNGKQIRAIYFEKMFILKTDVKKIIVKQ